MFKDLENKKIGTIIQRYLINVFLIGFIVFFLIIIVFQTIYRKKYAFQMITEYVNDVSKRTETNYNKRIKSDIDSFADFFEDDFENVDDKYLEETLKVNLDIFSEINIIDKNGIIIYSTVPAYKGYDMRSGKQSAEFLCLLNGTDYYEQGLQKISYDNTTEMTYVGKAFSKVGGFLQIGFTKDQYYNTLEDTFADEVRYRRIGLIGSIIILNSDYEVIGSTNDTFNGQTLKKKEVFPDEEGEFKETQTKIKGKDFYLVTTLNNGYYILGGFPVSEARYSNRMDNIIITLMYVLLLLCILFFLSRVLRIHVVQGIEDINSALSEIIDGNLEKEIDMKNSIEFKELSYGINHTVGRLREMIEEADHRLDKELRMASIIQSTSLPCIFPPFPKRKDIGLFASMDTCKEVGGDFYDYYLLQGNVLAVVIADVSDKGIPAALFMMKAKTVIKGLAVSGLPVNEVVGKANEELVKDNEANMFVTLWVGFIDLNTGLMHYVHAGHTCPMLIRKDNVTMIKQKRNFIVGGKIGIQYLAQEYQLMPGDALFLYTDGVTEAFDATGEEYGNERLENILMKKDLGSPDADPNEYCKEVCRSVREDVAAFSGDVPQSDDITMLCFKYIGK